MTPTPDDEDRSLWDRLAAIPDEHPPEPRLRTDMPTGTPLASSNPTPPPSDPSTRAPIPAAAPPPNPSDGAGLGADPRRVQITPGAAPPAPTAPPNDPTVSRPEPAPEPGQPERGVPRRRRRRGRWIGAIAAVMILGILAGGGLLAFTANKWSAMERVDTGGRLDTANGFTNYLIVGTDSRAAIDGDDPAAGDVGMGFEGERSDSMLILHIGPSGNRIVSLPRDLLVDIAGHGRNKLNAARAFGGAPLLIETVQTHLGVPIHRYLEVDLAGFMAVVDAVGGVPVDFPRAACDPKSGLDIRSTGEVVLDRRTALQYVRSRTYTEFDPSTTGGMTCAQIRSAGLGTTDGTSDIGRTERQREFLLTTLAKAAGSRNPLTLMRVLDGLSGGLRVDDAMGFGDALSLGRTARDLDAENLALPVGAAGNDLVTTAETSTVLERFRTG